MTAIAAQPFDFPYDDRLDTKATALVVIDMQRDFLSLDGYLAQQGYDPSPLRAIIPVVTKLIDACRTAGVQIIHTRQGYRADRADMTPYEKWRRRQRGLEDVLLRSSPGFAIIPELDVREEDIIVDKTCNSAFTYTDFEHILRAQGITHLMLTGCTTDVCVHTTLRDACDRNFQCLTVADACASGDAYAHEAALHMVTVEFGIWGTLANSAAVLDGLSRCQPVAA
jgi:nicotinamidase-related amidase